MSQRIRLCLLLVPALALGSATRAIAGGFWISIQTPSTVKDPAARNAVILVRADGCHNPADAIITGVAEGVVNGERRSIPLKLSPISQPGTYAVAPQWPAEGVWVLQFDATYMGRDTGTLVRLSPGRFEKQSTQLFGRKITVHDVETALKPS